jgi:hypothetical protein
MECASGHYVKNDGQHSGTVLDEAFIDTSGTEQGVGFGHTATSSVAWGHPFSRLATGIKIWAQNRHGAGSKPLAYKIVVKCTDSQADAWVILG